MRSLSRGLNADTPVQTISTEQSNSSVIIGGQVVMKLIRRVEDGLNPDVEVGRFLTEQVRFPHAPAVAGSIEYRRGDGDTAAIAVAQQFVNNEGPGWDYVIDALERVVGEVLAHPAPEEIRLDVPVRLVDAAEREPERSNPLVSPHLQWAEILGRRTAQMHLALASDDSDDAFAPEPFTAVDRRSLNHGTRSLLRRSLRSAQSMPARSACVDELLSREKEIFARLEAAMKIPTKVSKIRCHGDYHLGQVLWTGKDWVIIDFEGEPARPISARRLKRPALVDVAGMIRSFHYASKVVGTRTNRDLTLAGGRADTDTLLASWYRAISGAFLRSYLEAAGDAPFLPADREQLVALLDFLVLEKAIYEIGYEANNRPDWVDVPAHGVLDLLEVNA
jgi:maltose alpha-D-glucosyltransferase/alpha-amylase